MHIRTDSDLVEEIVTRSVDTIYPSTDALREKLLSGKQLRIYMGIDPTATYVHIGHATNYLILERLHLLGHKIIVLVGDFTAMIGDPSDKSSLRVQLTKEQVAANLQTFKQQIGKILDFASTDNPIEFRFNSDWLSKLTFADAVELASNFTVQQMIERDAFQKRITANKPLYVHEFFYPLMQGYDSVALDVDLEIGGTDQTFNMLAGRTLLKRCKDKEKCVMTTTLLINPKTNEKLMSKSQGTGVGLDLDPLEMFGKTMTLPDEGIVQCFIDCTRLPMARIEQIKHELESGVNPRDLKLLLAAEIVATFHSPQEAKKAKEDWVRQFSEREAPDQMDEFRLGKEEQTIVDMLLQAKFADTKSEAKRLVDGGAVKLNGTTIDQAYTSFKAGDVLKVGKRRYLRMVAP